jgi:cob(I)alamin adenosyltransferase
MKIYTRKGDRGKTTLAGGRPVSKSHIRIEAYGTLDELIAHLALLRDMLDTDETRADLLRAQESLMVCAAILATDSEDCDIKIPDLPETEVSYLENRIDTIEAGLEPLHSFILPGGHASSSQCHVARTVCRRAERIIIRLAEELFVPDVVIKYVNRFSDYLFVLSRKVLHDLSLPDTLWKPKL